MKLIKSDLLKNKEQVWRKLYHTINLPYNNLMGLLWQRPIKYMETVCDDFLSIIHDHIRNKIQ